MGKRRSTRIPGFEPLDDAFWTASGPRAYRQASTGIVFRRIPGGEVTVGLTSEHERLARKMEDPPNITMAEVQPAYAQSVQELLVSARPLSEVELARVDSKRQSVDARETPARVRFDVARRLAKGTGCRLPAEAEWEYFCRGGSDNLFVWGNQVPRRAELDRWFAYDFTRPNRMMPNAFGLYCLFFGEWTGDTYKSSHAPTAKARKGVHVVKGGAAFFWPWQDDSAWIWALPCIRMPSTDLLTDRCAAVRFVFPLD
jgi:hypothetical protein